MNHDIALIKLSEPITFGDNRIAPVCLPPSNSQSYEGYLGTVTGWGTTSYGK